MRAELLRFAALLVGTLSFPLYGANAQTAEALEAAQQEEAQPTVSLTVPLREGRVFRGEIDVRVAPDGSGLAVDARQLARLFEGKITEAAATQLITAANGDGFVTRLEAEQAALELDFNSAAVEVNAQFAGAARSLTTLSLAGTRDRALRDGRDPTGVSGFLNLDAFATADDFDGSYEINDPTFNLDGALHIAPWRHVTIEGGANISVDNGIRRTGVRAVLYDDEGEWVARAGDVGLSGISYMNSTSILGVEYSNRTRFQSRNNVVRSIGERSFFLERPSVARLIINGIEARTFNLDPGPYDVRDFPLADGANNVAFIIEDETGEIDRIEFDVFADVSLLAPGEYEYGVSAGIISSSNSSGFNSFDYDGDPAFSGFVEAGIANNLSAGMGAQATTEAQLVTGIARLGTSIGRFDVQAAASNDVDDTVGYAGQVSWRSRASIPYDFGSPSIGLSAEYRSEEFGGLFDIGTFNDTEWQFNASYSQILPYDISMGLGLGYAINRISRDDLTGSLSLGRSFGDWGIRAEGRYRSNTDDDDEWSGFLRLTYDIDNRSSAYAEYETDDNRFAAGYARTSERSGVGAWGYSVGTTYAEDSGVGLTGGGSYTGNRFEVSANQSANIDALGGGRNGMRTSLRAGTAIAFAEGKVAIGRPVRSGFAIFDTHPNLEDRPVLVGVSGDSSDYTASSGALGPALASIGGGLGVRTVAYDVDDLPLGYDLGSGIAQLATRYKSGFAVEVGSAYTVTAIGNLVDEFDEPLSLKIGTATSLDDTAAPEVEIFTNRAGRFGALGLGPGRWRLTMQTRPSLTYDLVVPQDAVGLLRTGELSPNEK